MKLKKSQQTGFTLIELLVVIAIIGLLSTLAIVALGTARLKARDVRRMSDLRTIYTALEMYNNDNGHYPITQSGGWWTCFDCIDYLSGQVTNPTAATISAALTPYLPNPPKDPKRTASSDSGYLYSSDGTSFLLMAWHTPENMNNYQASMVVTNRCGTINANGQCSTGNNTIGYWGGPSGAGY